jgi:glycosyltransferase involved in cell wall biosynthesis
MKILHTVESYYPSPGGMQEVVKQLSERLAKAGHHVTVATGFLPERKEKVINNVVIEPFDIKGNTVRGMQGQVDDYRKFLLNADFDIVTSFAAQQWATDIALPILSDIKGKKVFVPTGFSGFMLPEYQNYFEEMKTWMKNYDMNVFLSDDYRDINFARANGIEKNVIIPNGAAADEFERRSLVDIRKKLKIHPASFLVLHVGSYSGIKGHQEAAEIFFRSKIKKGVLLFIGNNTELLVKQKGKQYNLSSFLSFGNKKIIIRDDLSRAETVAAYHAADLFLFPSNIECSPIVLFECMASETPFLATDVGNSKEIIGWSGGGILLPTTMDKSGYSHARIPESVRLLNELYFDKQKREQLAKTGFEAWKNNFTWELIAKKYEELYKGLLH